MGTRRKSKQKPKNIRPTMQECDNMLKKARVLVEAGDIAQGCNHAKLYKDMTSLDIFGFEEMQEKIGLVIEEVDKRNYKGHRPPELAGEPAIKDQELFAFVWKSKHFKMDMYIKFVILNDVYYHVSLHES